MKLEQVEEYQLTEEKKREVADLLKSCFPEFPEGQVYYRQAPHFRVLAYIDNTLVGQVSIVFRNIAVQERLFSIFGISDFCVHPRFRLQGVAKKLLESLQITGKKSCVDFLVLLTTNSDFYLRQGFLSCSGLCRWVILGKEKTVGVVQRRLDQALMVKPLGKSKWPEGPVDFRGHLF